MADPNLSPEVSPKKHIGNRRSRPHAIKPGARTRKGLAPLTWRNDPWVRRRITQVAMLVASGYSFIQMEPAVSEWCEYEGQPSVRIQQLKLDYRHYWDLMRDEVKIDAEEHAEALRLFKREGLQAFRDRGRLTNLGRVGGESAIVRAAGLNAALEAEKQLMRLSGAVDQPAVLQQNVVIQTLNPDLVGSDEYRKAVGTILALLPGQVDTVDAVRPDDAET